ncbi:hypothetical protein MNB_SV-14-1152 [hydrothermal vent metagenome]|uniref:Uncharacterized protein n=1 Tax=hydrothermal vent metagenome TaxID=652676 RepID=A0A1W1CG58_9ZZZZ
MIGLLATKEETLKFLIKNYFRLSQKKLAEEFEVTEAEMSKIINNHEKKLKNIHLLGFCYLQNIPYEIFNTKKFNTEEKVVSFLDNLKKDKKKEIFCKDEVLFNNLVGVWYAYFYPGSSFGEIYSIKTTIHDDHSISDENGNYGQLLIGELQSVIIKKARNSKNFISILFDNADVAFELFHFSMLSKRNHVKREMCNFGFFSRTKINLEVAEKILGEKRNVQLKMDCDFKERVAEYAEIYFE